MSASALASSAHTSANAPVKYPPHSSFRERLNRRVDEYFARTGKSRTGGPATWIKSLVLLAWAATTYLLLVFVATTWWQVALGTVSMGLAIAGVGFNVQHDGSHGAFTTKPWVNRMAAFALDLMGGSSYFWHCKHNVLHHHFTNVDGVDDDLRAEPFLRLGPGQPRYWFHRFQHLYIWPLYALLPAKWQWYDDYEQLAIGRIGEQPIPRPKGWELAGLFFGKALFLTWALVVPFFVHSPGVVLLVYAGVCLVTGVTLGTVFQLAHCVEEAQFPFRPRENERLPLAWAEHQIATTVDFSPRNPLLTWYLGGLNFQVEHHLFPKISHRHYPALLRVVRETCAEEGIQHHTFPNLRSALGSHMRHLKRMGRAA